MDVREDPGQYYPGGSVIPRTPEPAQERVVLDNTVTETSANGVKSSGIWSWVKSLLSWGNITGKPETFTPSNHLHSQSSVTGLLDALAGKFNKTGGTISGTVSVNSGSASAVTVHNGEGGTTVTIGCDNIQMNAEESGCYVQHMPDGSINYGTTEDDYSIQLPQKSGTLAVTSDIPSVDSTLEVSGAAADAATVGEKLSEKVGIDADGNVEISGEMTVCGIFRVDGGGEIDVMQDGNKVSLMSSGAIVLNDSTRLEFPTQEGTFALTTDPASGLTDDAVTALFASSVSSTTSTTLKDRDCSVVAYSSGMTLTFTASTGLRQFEILITDCTAGGSINFPDVTYRGASDALTLEAGDNHLVFAEYAANCFFVTRSVANTITIS